MTIYPMIFAASFNGELFPKPRAMPVRPSFFQITRSSLYLLGPSFHDEGLEIFPQGHSLYRTILSFMAGCLAAGFAVLREGVYGAFYGYALLVIAMILVHLSDRYGGTEEEEAMDRIKEVEEEEKMPV